MARARVEVLHPGTNPVRQYWRSRDGAVILSARQGGLWTATVDRRQVMDDDDAHAPLSASSAASLAELLAIQENVHALLDAEETWVEDAAGWPVSLRTTG